MSGGAPPGDDDAADVLRLVRATGLPGFKSSAGKEPAAPEGDHDLAIIRAAGLSGFTAAATPPPESRGHPAPVQAPAPGPAPAAQPQMTRQSYADLLGELGSPALRMSVRPIERSRYELCGPGASIVGDGRGAPQLPLGLPKACRGAMGR